MALDFLATVDARKQWSNAFKVESYIQNLIPAKWSFKCESKPRHFQTLRTPISSWICTEQNEIEVQERRWKTSQEIKCLSETPVKNPRKSTMLWPRKQLVQIRARSWNCLWRLTCRKKEKLSCKLCTRMC